MSAMEYTRRFFVLLLVLTAVPTVKAATEETSLTRQLARCAALGDDQQRLACYDELASKLSIEAGQPGHLDLIQPPASFLDSHLVAVPWKAEYTLTVRSFVKLISQAVLENGKHITVQGWSRDKHQYVLNIIMGTPVKLRFLPREPARQNTSMSLLQKVTMDGHTIGAGEFIMIIAAMVPDENSGEAAQGLH